MPNYRSFDEVLRELEMDEDELKRLVSEGQIRAFRDEDRMKFRSEDVHALSSQKHRQPGSRGAVEPIDFGDTQIGGEGLEIVEEETDETLLDLGALSADQDFEDTGATSVPTVELSDVGDDPDATLTEELVFDETDELGGLDFGEDDAEATQRIDTLETELDLGEDEDLGLQTEPLDELEELDDLGELDEEPVTQMETGGDYGYEDDRMAGPPMGMPGPMQISEQVKYVEIVPNEGILWKILSAATFFLILLCFTTFPAIGAVQGEDVLADFWGNTGFTVYTKSANPALQDKQVYRTDLTPEAKKDIPTAASVGSKNNQIVWAGQDVIRNFDGKSIHSGATSGGEDDAEE